MSKSFLFILATFAFISFHSCNQDRDLRRALKLAGNNRSELEKVLHHYSRDHGDSLKLRAAEFLIANMPGHYTLSGEKIDSNRKRIYSNTDEPYFARKALDMAMPFFMQFSEPGKLQDIWTIGSDFLIRHIDLAFEQMETYPWLEDFPFDLFMEFLLPYRMMEEKPDYWRELLKPDTELYETIVADDRKKYLPLLVSGYLLMDPPNTFASTQFQKTILGAEIAHDCYALCVKELLEWRLMGIPSTIDFIPFYGNRNGYHYWVAEITPESKLPDVKYAVERSAPKIYRMTYKRQKAYFPAADEYMPELFKNPFIRDVTDLYANTRSLTVKNVNKFRHTHRHAYLCVFNNLQWQATAIGKFRRAKADFECMGENMVYLPIAYRGEEMIPINYPFILHRNGRVDYLVPETSARQKLMLTRKFPGTTSIDQNIRRMDKSYWIASNAPDFNISDTVFKYHYSRDRLITDCRMPEISPYRYWKFIPGAKATCSIAQFYFSMPTAIL